MKTKTVLISICCNGEKKEAIVNNTKEIESTMLRLTKELNMKKGDKYDIVVSMGNKVLMHRYDEAV